MQDNGLLHGGRAHYMLILISGKLIGFLNIYAPNSTTEIFSFVEYVIARSSCGATLVFVW